MKSTIRFSTIAATLAIAAFGVSTAFAATYVPHEDNFGLSSSVTAQSTMPAAAKADAHTMKSSDAMQTASAKHVAPMDNKSTRRADPNSAM